MKLKKVVFDEDGFRNLKNLTLHISPRLTIIAGHNGIGKSTILGLIANGSEIKSSKTLLDKAFKSDFSEIFHLNYDDDIIKRKQGASKATLIYEETNGIEVRKDCKVTGNHKVLINKKMLKPFMPKIGAEELTDKQRDDLEKKQLENPNEKYVYTYRMRVIPRTNLNHPDTDLLFLKNNNLEGAAKVPIPTVYLGMSRVSPIGEFDDAQINIKSKNNIEYEVADYIYSFFNSVIKLKSSNDKSIHSHSFVKNNKQSLVPNFEHSSLSISLGQDSLSSIVTAFASFKKLKLELKDEYKGGILVIDEIEAGLHPKAQLKLIKKIQSEARKLDLQVVATSHSLTVMKYLLDFNSNIALEKQTDSLIYLTDTNLPHNMTDLNYTKIKSDMLLVEPTEDNKKDFTKVYLEDDEAKYFFDKILEFKHISTGNVLFGRNLESISLKIGCEILIKLANADTYFKTAVLVADNDVASRNSNRTVIKENDNFCTLPPSKYIDDNSPPYRRSPEVLLYDFLKRKYDNMDSNQNFWLNMGNYNSNYVEEYVLNLTETDLCKRDIMKKWFINNFNFLDDANICLKWCEENHELVDQFIRDLDKAVNKSYQNLEISKEHI